MMCATPVGAGAPVGETRKVVTILFADVKGSTAIGERLDPEAVRRVLSTFYASARESLERHGGTVEKFIGDAVMAVFGVPGVHEDDAARGSRRVGPARRDGGDELRALRALRGRAQAAHRREYRRGRRGRSGNRILVRRRRRGQRSDRVASNP
jgi:class 3 adenylate cyclase